MSQKRGNGLWRSKAEKVTRSRILKRFPKESAREYWIVDPERETVAVYDFAHSGVPGTGVQTDGSCALSEEACDAPVNYVFSEQMKAGIFENLWLDFSEMDLN